MAEKRAFLVWLVLASIMSASLGFPTSEYFSKVEIMIADKSVLEEDSLVQDLSIRLSSSLVCLYPLLIQHTEYCFFLVRRSSKHSFKCDILFLKRNALGTFEANIEKGMRSFSDIRRVWDKSILVDYTHAWGLFCSAILVKISFNLFYGT